VSGRYKCSQGKIVTKAKANRICLIRRCPDLQIQYRKGKFKSVIPVGLLETKGC